MRLSIIGSGVIGETAGIVFHMKGNDVMFYDIDKRKMGALKRQGYKVANSITTAVKNSDILLICVPTPTINKEMNFSYVKKATVNIAKALSKTNDYKVVVVRSTVLPSTTRCKVVPLLQRYSKSKPGKDFGVCVNPEFLREKYALHDFLNPSRIVIGELDKRSGDVLEKIYSSFDAPIIRTNLDAAETIKYVSNFFLAAKISFFNEIYMICCKLGLDADFISEAVSLDSRIGKYGVYGGKPFGGKCLPKDVEAFVNYVKCQRINPKLLEVILSINKEIASYVSKKPKRKRTKRQSERMGK